MGKTIIIKWADFSANRIGGSKCMITYAFTNIDATSKPMRITAGSTLSIQLIALNTYTLPPYVSVTETNTGVAIAHVYNPSTGELTIPNIAVDITISAQGQPVASALGITYNLTNVNVDSNQPRNFLSGTTVNIQFTKVSGYDFPANITVTNTSTGDTITSGVTYNSAQGSLTITGATVDITITATGVAEQTSTGFTLTEANISDYQETVGGIIASTGAISSSSYDQWRCTADYIDISAYSTFALVTDNHAQTFGIAWYDENQSFVSGIKFDNELDLDISDNVPAGAKYLRYCCQTHPHTGSPKTITINFYE